jgi:hypothetical protein
VYGIYLTFALLCVCLTDSYAFGIVMLELFTGLAPNEVIQFVVEEGAREHIWQADPRAGTWQSKQSAPFVAIAQECAEARAADRATVEQVLPGLEALLSPLFAGLSLGKSARLHLHLDSPVDATKEPKKCILQ